MNITLITGGAPHYEAGLIAGLTENGVQLNVIGGDDLASAPALKSPHVRFHNFYHGSEPQLNRWRKLRRVFGAYVKLLAHAATCRDRLIHVQWPYKFPLFDRTLLNLWCRTFGKKMVFTAHNIDSAARDGKSSRLNRLSLWLHYRLMNHIIVHTERMKQELAQHFGVRADKISVIPHGVMSAVPESNLTRTEARRKLGLTEALPVLLAFGLIAPYKGLEYLVSALGQCRRTGQNFTLVIAGRVKECPDYWRRVEALIKQESLADRVIAHLRHIPDADVEIYFKAADALVMPYRNIFQSGVIFLAWRFGLPVIATDVGSLREMIADGKNGFICRADDAADLARTLDRFVASDLFAEPERHRAEIRQDAFARYSWSVIGAQTRAVYEQVLAGKPQRNESPLPQTATS